MTDSAAPESIINFAFGFNAWAIKAFLEFNLDSIGKIKVQKINNQVNISCCKHYMQDQDKCLGKQQNNI